MILLGLIMLLGFVRLLDIKGSAICLCSLQNNLEIRWNCPKVFLHVCFMVGGSSNSHKIFLNTKGLSEYYFSWCLSETLKRAILIYGICELCGTSLLLEVCRCVLEQGMAGSHKIPEKASRFLFFLNSSCRLRNQHN